MKITVEMVMALKPCHDWPEERVRAILGDGLDTENGLEAVLTLDPADARWLLARLLSQENRVAWAKAAAARTKGYAAIAYYVANAGHAGHAAAAAYTVNAAEHRLACEHALSLL